MTPISNIFLPKERVFFDLFEEAAANIHKSAELLVKLFDTYPDNPHLAGEVLRCEQQGDRITHDIIHHLHQTFVTPIDREDIYDLSSALDDIADYTEEAADFLGLYRVKRVPKHAKLLTQVLAQATYQIQEAMPRLRKFKDLRHYTVEINRLENEGDRITREALALLFADEQDPMTVIRWKDIFDRLECAVDATEHVANILEGIVIKNS